MAFKIADGYVEVHGRVDDPSFRRAAKRVTEAFERDTRSGATRAGHKAGANFADAFGLMSARRFRRMTHLFMDPINVVSGALSAIRGPSMRAGFLSSILGLIPSLGKATTAIGAGLIPAMVSLGSVIGVVRLMLGRLDKSIKSQTLKALDAMAGKMKELAREAAKPGLNRFFEGVVKNGPMFERYIARIAKAVGAALGEIGALLSDSAFGGKLAKLLDSAAKGTRSWTSALDAVVDMVVTLGAAAGPIFEDFARRIATIVERWRKFLDLKYETGELQAFLRDAAEELDRWGRILNNVIIGLFNIFAAGVGPSSRFAENLERITASFRKWTEESANVEKVRKVFQFMVDHVGDFFRIAASALLIASALKAVGLAVEAITWGHMLAALGPVGVALGLVGLAIAGVAAAFFVAYNSSETFRAKVSELWSMVSERLLPILKEWGTWFKEEAAPVLEKFANETMAKLIEGFDHILDKLEENKEGLREFGELLLDLEPIFGFFASRAVEEVTGLIGQIITVIGWIGRLAGAIKDLPIKRTLEFLFKPGDAIATILRITGLTKAIPRIWRTSWKFLANLGPVRAVIRQIRSIPRAWRTAWKFLANLGPVNAVKRALASIPRRITSVVTTIRNVVTRGIGGLFGGLFGNAHGGIVGARGMQTGGISSGRSVLVGEQGPELVNLPFGSRVVPAGQTRATLGRGGGASQPVVLEIRSGGSRIDDVLVELLRKAIRTQGGNVQLVLGSS